MSVLVKQKGFTLLELLVALAILSLVALTALNNNVNMVGNAEYLRDKTLAHWVAMNRAAEIRLDKRFIGDDGAEGVSIMAERRWSWRVTGQSTPDPNVQLIEIEVWPGTKRKDSSLAFLSMYLGR
ncbi:MAG: type II secretion system minor pseudopilin GspI [Desulfurivibrionaceae bacterium]|nr:type II secretion system minor pseudopilin GspI [Desulfobulbales bacterium]MDT8334075.1 type II secretion system minor pseudopilin GspI [Desulfurivibrionaceae bacterium]